MSMLVTRMVKTGTNSLSLSPKILDSNIRHQHRCNQLISNNFYSSALKFILQELTDMALKHYSRIQIFDQDDDPI